MPRRIGLFGGTFDPPHRGHVAAASTVRQSLGLDTVILMVAGDPWQKSGGARAVTAASVRLAMTEAALAGHDGLIAGDAEIRRGGPSYTVETVAEIHREHPGSEVWVIVGADTAAGIATWRDYHELARSATMVAVTRPGHPLTEHGSGIEWHRVEMEPVDVSSTRVRDRISAGEHIGALVAEGWVSPAVAEIIEREGLYGSGATA